MIVLTGVEVASNTDLLANSRLTSIPYAGELQFRCSADLNNATNRFALTIELPGGMIPIDGQRVPATNPALGGVLDERFLLQFAFPATFGGHFIITATETGAAIFTWMAALVP